MIYAIIIITLLLIAYKYWLFCKRISALERETQARIEHASHEAFYNGFIYANQQAAMRHPRDSDGKFTSKS